MSQNLYTFNKTEAVSSTKIDYVDEWVETVDGLLIRIERLEEGARFVNNGISNKFGSAVFGVSKFG